MSIRASGPREAARSAPQPTEPSIRIDKTTTPLFIAANLPGAMIEQMRANKQAIQCNIQD